MSEGINYLLKRGNKERGSDFIAANEPVSPRGDKQIADAITVLVGHCEKQISLKVSGESGVYYKGASSNG